MVKFIVTVYAPMWFRVKRNHSCINGPQNLFEMIRSAKYLRGEQRTVVRNAIQRNAFFAHPESIILAMVFDQCESYRQKAISLIRNANKSQKTVRKFELPPLNFNSTSCYNLINLNNVEITVPPMLSNLNVETLEHLYESDEGIQISRIPCHSQAVERCVKLVTEGASSVTEETRHGFNLNRIVSRKKMPKFDTKGDFALN